MEPSRQTWSSYGPPYPLGRWSLRSEDVSFGILHPLGCREIELRKPSRGCVMYAVVNGALHVGNAHPPSMHACIRQQPGPLLPGAADAYYERKKHAEVEGLEVQRRQFSLGSLRPT